MFGLRAIHAASPPRSSAVAVSSRSPPAAWRCPNSATPGGTTTPDVMATRTVNTRQSGTGPAAGTARHVHARRTSEID